MRPRRKGREVKSKERKIGRRREQKESREQRVRRKGIKVRGREREEGRSEAKEEGERS